MAYTALEKQYRFHGARTAQRPSAHVFLTWLVGAFVARRRKRRRSRLDVKLLTKAEARDLGLEKEREAATAREAWWLLLEAGPQDRRRHRPGEGF